MLQWPLESLIEKNMTQKRNRSAMRSKKKVAINNQRRSIVRNLGLRVRMVSRQRHLGSFDLEFQGPKVVFYKVGPFFSY